MGVSNRVEAVTSMRADSYNANATFYNYYYDNQIIYGSSTVNQAKENHPFKIFNSLMAQTDYATCTNAIPMYFGSLWAGANGNYNESTAKNINALTGENLVNFYWCANLSLRNSSGIDRGPTETPQYYAAIQNLVDSALSSDGIPQKNGENVPFFDTAWLTDTKYEGNDIADIISDVEFAFYKKEVQSDGIAELFPLLNQRGDSDKLDGTYYIYDSLKDVFRVREDGTYESESNAVDTKKVKDTLDCVGFFPFNDANTDKNSLQYGFGTQFEIEFQVSSDGKVDGEDMIFAFKGDDDLWVFIDDALVLDIGGDHKPSEGYINFATGDVVVAKAHDAYSNNIVVDADEVKESATTIAESFSKANVDNTFKQENGEYDEETIHTMKIFFVERGMGNSNLYIQFNMSVVPNMNTLTVKNEVSFNNVNNGLKKPTSAVVDNDVFTYAISNKGTNTINVVNDTGILYPDYEYIRRLNTKAFDQMALLSGMPYTIETIIVTDYVYLDLGTVDWAAAGAVFYAWIWETGKNGRLVEVEHDNVSGYYRVAIEECDNILFLRINPQNLPTSTTSFPSRWNQTNDMKISADKNIVKLTNMNTAEWSDDVVSKTVVLTDVERTDNYFLEEYTSVNTDEFYAVAKTNYDLFDTFAQIQNADGTWSKYSGTVAGQTSEDGILNLMYNESAKFSGQFKQGSTMQIVQNDALNTPVRGEEGTIVSFTKSESDRAVSKYYTTTVNLTGVLESEPNADNQFLYDNGTTEKVRMIETFYNEVKTGDLAIVKSVKTGDDSTAGTFTFKITLTKLFGSEWTVEDYQGIEYELYDYDKNTGDWSASYTKETLRSDGTFDIGPNQKAVIRGIPIETEYTIKEVVTGDYETQDIIYDDEQTITFGYDSTATVVNVRKVGELVLKKDVKNVDGTDNDISDEDKTAKFEFIVHLTAPTGVDLSRYDVAVEGLENDEYNISADHTTVTISQISESTSFDGNIKIINIPYGTKYYVEEIITNTKEWRNVSGTDDISGILSSETVTAIVTNQKLTTEAYLTITKYIDGLYYTSDDNAHGFMDNISIMPRNNNVFDEHGYLAYTNAEQDFTFEIKEYDGGTLVGTYQILLKFTADEIRLEKAETQSGISYYYVQSKRFSVNAGHKYVVTETGLGTGISWRYGLAYAKGSLNGPVSANNSGSGANDTITFEYADAALSVQNAAAIFYSKRTTASQKIESDMSSITQLIVGIK